MNKLKNNNGFTQTDIIVSIAILFLFVGLVATLFINSYNASTESKRNAEATAYLTQIFESIDLINYDELDSEEKGIVKKIDELNKPEEIGEKKKISATYVENGNPKEQLSTPYKVEVEITNYNQTEGNTEKEDLVKIITITIKYNVNNKEQKISSKRLKTKEIAYIDNLEIAPIYYNGMIPLVYDNLQQQTTIYASNWFNYQDQKVAQITLKDNLSYENENSGKISNLGSVFVYIPRFAYNIEESGNVNIKLLNTDNTCKDGSSTTIYNEEDNIDNSKYYIPSCFSQNGIQIEGMWLGKYLSKKNLDGNNANVQISVVPEGENENYWTDLTEEQKQERADYIIDENSNYGIKQNANAKVADDSINNMIEKLKGTDYDFIYSAIEEKENAQEGAFRIFIY